MAQVIRSEAHGDIDVFISVDVPDTRPFGLGAGNGINHLFPQLAKIAGCSRVTEMSAMLLGERLGFCGSCDCSGNQLIQRGLLFFRESAR